MAVKQRGTAAPKRAAKQPSKKGATQARRTNRHGRSSAAPESTTTATDVLHGSSSPLIRAAFSKRLRQGP